MDQKNQIYGLGRRKRAIAQIILTVGTGEFLINNKDSNKYFHANQTAIQKIKQPLTVLGLENKYNIKAKTKGGGLMGQADAIKLGTSRALLKVDVRYRKLLKTNNLLKCDSRVIERKKYGLKKARKASQFSKR